MNQHLSKSNLNSLSTIQITGSKSESNRLLILKALHGGFDIDNLSNADDTKVLLAALTGNNETVDIHHAGTAMRFLTAYFSVQEGKETILTGSSRMKERPIGVLVDALRSLGAQITYLENEGYPPLKIKGQQIDEKVVEIKADVSSQYISALILIGSRLKNGLTIKLKGEITSIPYIEMTLELLNRLGIATEFKNNEISIPPYVEQANQPNNVVVESDWSSASYFYSLVALSSVGTKVHLSAYRKASLQGDSCLSTIYETFGVTTQFLENEIILEKTTDEVESAITLDLAKAPDIAQTIAVSCFALQMKCHLTGLHTLKIKETDRLVALKIELEKLGAQVHITEDSLTLEQRTTINENIAIDTYQDHRMAMAFAPLALRVNLTINEAEVVSKSYPDFWEHMQRIGIDLKRA